MPKALRGYHYRDGIPSPGEIAMATRSDKKCKIRNSAGKTQAPKASGTVSVAPRELAGQALLDDMEAYRKEVTATPEAARNFLIRLGVMTPDGSMKTLIHD